MRCLNLKPIRSRNILVSANFAQGCTFFENRVITEDILKDFPAALQTENERTDVTSHSPHYFITRSTETLEAFFHVKALQI